MKLFTGWVISAGLVMAAGGANAQVLTSYEAGRAPYRVVSDIGGPYAAMPREARVPDYVPGYGPRLLPPHEVYTVLRENGFSPLGIPVRRGFFYSISVIDRGGDDGRLIINARNGRILRFLPANRMGDNFDDLTSTYDPPPAADVRGEPRLPRAAPKVASRTTGVPVPKPRAGQARPLAAAPSAIQPVQPAAVPPARQAAAAVPAKPADPQTTGQTAAPATAAPAVEARPAPQILPTQDMPKAQGLE